MEQENVSVHYSDIAGHYDNIYDFTNNYMAGFAIKHWPLKPDDRLVDIGAGSYWPNLKSNLEKSRFGREYNVSCYSQKFSPGENLVPPPPPFLWVKFLSCNWKPEISLHGGEYIDRVDTCRSLILTMQEARGGARVYVRLNLF